MNSNYPDSTSEHDPGAPWNQEPAPLKCDVCHERSEDGEPGDVCPQVFKFDDGSGHGTPTDVDCEGTLREVEDD